jgi:hypothetical protein
MINHFFNQAFPSCNFINPVIESETKFILICLKMPIMNVFSFIKRSLTDLNLNFQTICGLFLFQLLIILTNYMHWVFDEWIFNLLIVLSSAAITIYAICLLIQVILMFNSVIRSLISISGIVNFFLSGLILIVNYNIMSALVSSMFMELK